MRNHLDFVESMPFVLENWLVHLTKRVASVHFVVVFVCCRGIGFTLPDSARNSYLAVAVYAGGCCCICVLSGEYFKTFGHSIPAQCYYSSSLERCETPEDFLKWWGLYHSMFAFTTPVEGVLLSGFLLATGQYFCSLVPLIILPLFAKEKSFPAGILESNVLKFSCKSWFACDMEERTNS